MPKRMSAESLLHDLGILPAGASKNPIRVFQIGPISHIPNKAPSVTFSNWRRLAQVESFEMASV